MQLNFLGVNMKGKHYEEKYVYTAIHERRRLCKVYQLRPLAEA